jgi:D-serine deaminase-like pyridoxal phosphate-dependent protein
MPQPDPLSFFNFDKTAQRIEDLETPVPLIDIDIMTRNIARWQAQCDALGIANWPHIKTHKLVPVAKLQLAMGAKGICVQKLGEAEVMADAGIENILLTFNVVGASKLARLAALRKRIDIAIVADSPEVVDGLRQAAAAAGQAIRVLVECDTGMGRNGVQTPAAAVDLAKMISSGNGLVFDGLMTYPKAYDRPSTSRFIREAKVLLSDAGLLCNHVSSGGSKDLWDKTGLDHITQYRAGTNVYFDRSLIAAGTCTLNDCAVTILTTVVSTPTTDRAIIDAGSKALTSDLLGLEHYGCVPALADAPVYNVNEEHGYLDVRSAAHKPKVGDALRVLPNHVCPVNNLFDHVVFVRGEDVLGSVRVDARGKVQ